MSFMPDESAWMIESRRPLWAMTSLCALLLSGCISVGPDFETPEAEVEEQWLGAEDDRVNSDSADTLEWWKQFNDPVLESLIQQAHEQNPTLQIAGLRVYEARTALGFAVGTVFPQSQSVGADYRGIVLSEKAEPVSNLPDDVAQRVDTEFSNFRVGFDAAWELDFWGRFRRGIESADANLAATIASYDDVLVTLTGEVALAYVLLRTLEERLAVAESNIALQQRSLEISEVRNRNQLTTELDPALARALLRDTQAATPRLKAGIRKVKNALSVLLGKPPGALETELAAGQGIPVSQTDLTVGIPADLMRRRPDIRRAELRAAAQSARIGIKKADLFPALVLIGSIGTAADKGPDLFSSASTLGWGLVGFHWNVFNYGRIRSLVRGEDARFQQLIVHYQNTVLKAAREVEDATISFLAAQEEVEFLADGAMASERAVELSMIQYREGIADYIRVLDSQRFLLLQQDLEAQARGKVAASWVAVYKALGGGWEQRDLDNLVSPATRETMSERTNWGGLLEQGAIAPVSEEDRGSVRVPDF
jgi:NodT family efflux transporter outer membrane factor (OMF) lipoprotein